MKKYSLLKAIGIVIIAFMLLTWFVPISSVSGNDFVNKGYVPMGLFDLLLLPFRFFSWDNSFRIVNEVTGLVENNTVIVSFASNVVALLSIGIFYKVLNKTGAYGKLIEEITKKQKNNLNIVAILSIVLFAILSSLTGLTLLLFALVPFGATILLKLGLPKLKVLASTVLPILVGRACSILAWDVTGVNNVFFGVPWNNNLLVRIMLLIIFIILLSAYVVLVKLKEEEVPKNKKSKKTETIECPLYDGIVKEEKSCAPMIALTSVFFIIIAICMYNWYYTFNSLSITEGFATIKSNTISGYPFVSNLLGIMEPFGYWSGFTMSAILLLLSALIAFMYSLTFDDFVESVKDGIKSMGCVAIYVVLASLITVFINHIEFVKGENANVFYTISEFVNKNISFETVPFSTITAGIYGIFVNDYSLVAYQATDYLGIFFADGAINLAVLCFQIIYGLMSIITPTSIFLIAGLVYLDIPYKKWISYIWKFFLSLLVLSLLILLIISII